MAPAFFERSASITFDDILHDHCVSFCLRHRVRATLCRSVAFRRSGRGWARSCVRSGDSPAQYLQNTRLAPESVVPPTSQLPDVCVLVLRTDADASIAIASVHEAVPRNSELFAVDAGCTHQIQKCTLTVRMSGVNGHNTMLFEAVIDTAPLMAGLGGRPRQRPHKVHADKSYGDPESRCAPAQHGRDLLDRRSSELHR